MSALPKAVQRQIDKANRVADNYYKSLAEGGAPAVPTAEEAAAAAATPDGAAAAAPAAVIPAATPAPAAADGVVSIPQQEWEQKYRVLQGKYNAEVPRLQAQVRDLIESSRQNREQLTATQTLLASLGDRQSVAPAGGAQPSRTPAAPVSLIKDEEVKEFGADLIDVTRRVAREEIASQVEAEVARRMQPVAQRVEQVAQSAGSTAKRVSQQDQQSVLAYLAEKVPNWAQLNNDQDFIAWLDQKDPFSGQVRGQMLDQAYQSHDGPRVVMFFNGYLKEHAAVSAAPAPAAPAANAAAPAPQRTLEQLVTPGTPKTGAAGTQDGSGKRVWTRAEISMFYANKSAGRYNSTDGKAKAAAMEADIFAAQSEGRVR